MNPSCAAEEVACQHEGDKLCTPPTQCRAPETVDEDGSDKVEQHCTHEQCHGREDDIRQPRSARTNAWNWRDGAQVDCAAVQRTPPHAHQREQHTGRFSEYVAPD